jgi:hypothetical protein
LFVAVNHAIATVIFATVSTGIMGWSTIEFDSTTLNNRFPIYMIKILRIKHKQKWTCRHNDICHTAITIDPSLTSNFNIELLVRKTYWYWFLPCSTNNWWSNDCWNRKRKFILSTII